MMCSFAVIGAVVVGLCFEVVKYWPLPVSIAPYFGFQTAACWGFIVGGINGLVLGYLTDDNHFDKVSYK